MTNETKSTNPKNEYFDVDSLLKETENTIFTLHRMNKTVAQGFDDKAEELREMYSDSCFADVFEEEMRNLVEERLICMSYIAVQTKCLVEQAKQADWKERTKILREAISLMKEHKALIEQSYVLPWSRYTK